MDKDEQLKNFSEKAIKSAGDDQTLLSIATKTLKQIEHLNETNDSKWKKQQSWHFWGTIISIFAVALTAINVFLVYIGMTYMPEETKALFDTAINTIRFW